MSDSKEPMENVQDKIEHILLYGSIDDINKPIDDKGFTPLHYCVQGCGYNLPIKTKYNELVKELLKSEANPDVQDNDGDTPLMIASKFGDSFTMRELLVAGADPNIKNKDDMDALSYCSKKKQYNSLCIRILLYYGYKFFCDDNRLDLFKRAIWKNDIETFKYFLINYKNDIKKYIEFTNIDLTNASTVEMLNLLLEEGFDPNPNEKEYVTDNFLSYWVAFREDDLVKRLLEAGANPDGDAYNEKPLFAITYNNSDYFFIKMLLEAGANPNIKRGGKSFIMSFLEYFKDIYSILLKHGASIDSDFLQRFCREIIHMTKDNQLKKTK